MADDFVAESRCQLVAVPLLTLDSLAEELCVATDASVDKGAQWTGHELILAREVLKYTPRIRYFVLGVAKTN